MKKTETTKASLGARLLHIFLWSSAYFTVISVALLLTQSFDSSMYVSPTRFLLIYPFSLVMALGNLVIKSRSIKTFAKTLLHCIMTISALYLFLILPTGNVANTLVVLLVFAAIYFLIATPILVVVYIKRKKAEEQIPYQAMFTKQKSRKG